MKFFSFILFKKTCLPYLPLSKTNQSKDFPFFWAPFRSSSITTTFCQRRESSFEFTVNGLNDAPTHRFHWAHLTARNGGNKISNAVKTSMPTITSFCCTLKPFSMDLTLEKKKGRFHLTCTKEVFSVSWDFTQHKVKLPYSK